MFSPWSWMEFQRIFFIPCTADSRSTSTVTGGSWKRRALRCVFVVPTVVRAKVQSAAAATTATTSSAAIQCRFCCGISIIPTACRYSSSEGTATVVEGFQVRELVIRHRVETADSLAFSHQFLSVRVTVVMITERCGRVAPVLVGPYLR